MSRDARTMPFRVASHGLLSVTVAAVLLGQFASRGTRSACPASAAIVGREFFGLGAPGTWLLDGSGRGTLRPLRLPNGVRLARASVSPWLDEEGRRQAIGLGWRLVGEEMCADFAMVRCTLPDGGVLASVSLGSESPPGGPPCWRPGKTAEVVYAGMDNRLYRLAFERGQGDAFADVSDPRPQPLSWRPSAAGRRQNLVTDPCWPSDPRLGGRLLAAVQSYGEGRRCHSAWAIWWLRLDESGSEIVDAGPLARGDLKAPVEMARHPSLVKDSAGRLHLAFLGGSKGKGCDRLCVVPLQVDPATGDPWFDGSSVRVLARGCLAVAPLGSSDGREITVLLRGEGEMLARSFPLADYPGLAGR